MKAVTPLSAQAEVSSTTTRPTVSLPRVLHVARCLAPIKGGTSESIPALARATAATGRFDNHLLQFGEDQATPPACAGVPLKTLPWQPVSLLTAPRSVLWADVSTFDAFHLHGIWEPQCAAVGSIARALRRPYVVSAHGMLDQWALKNKAWKKKLYGALAERQNLKGAACYRALTRSEVADYRRYGLTGPVAIIPNGVNIPQEQSSRLFLESFPQLNEKRIVLFLSRIHYKKGVDILCRAWARIRTSFPDTQLVIAGPDFENTLTSIRTLVSELQIEGSVTFTGMLFGHMKWSALSSASLFVLPSHSEGFSVAILEAMASGVPVLATHPCNFPSLSENGAGNLINPNVDELERELREMLEQPARELRIMGQRGLDLVSRAYTWDAIGHMMAEVYEWLLGASMPTNVEIDLS